MNPTQWLHAKLRVPALCVLSALLCSCASTSIKNTWKTPDGRIPVTNIAVLTVEERGLLRQGFENRFHQQLAAAGARPQTTYELFSLAQIKADKRAAGERLLSSGAEAVLILRLVDKTSAYREYQPGRERYAPVVTGFDTMGWYDYYSVAFIGLGATYGSSRATVFLETSLHDLKTEKRLWSALTQTVVTEGMDRVAEMDPLIEKIVAAMKRDGVIP